MLFGTDNEKGIRFDAEAFSLEVTDARANQEQVLRHDETNKVLANMLVELVSPIALGVIYKNPAESFEKSWHALNGNRLKRRGKVADALRATNTWTVT